MLRLLIPILFIAFVVAIWKFRAVSGGHRLRKTSRPVRNDQVNALLARLADAAGIGQVELRLLDDPSINGLATDTGDIYVTRGLFDKFRSGQITGAELASVAAHELGHLALGHTKRRMVEVGGRQATHLVLGSILGRIIPYFGWYLSGWLLDLVTAKLSRRDEFEADAYATALMIRAGLGAEPQASMLEKLPALVGAEEAQAPRWLASHPPVAERTAAIRDNAERWQQHAPDLLT